MIWFRLVVLLLVTHLSQPGSSGALLLRNNLTMAVAAIKYVATTLETVFGQPAFLLPNLDKA